MEKLFCVLFAMLLLYQFLSFQKKHKKRDGLAREQQSRLSLFESGWTWETWKFSQVLVYIRTPPLPDPSKSTCRLRTGISSNPRRRLSLPGFSVIVFPKTSSLKIKQSPVYIPCCRALSYTVHNTDGVKTSKERNGAEWNEVAPPKNTMNGGRQISSLRGVDYTRID